MGFNSAFKGLTQPNWQIKIQSVLRFVGCVIDNIVL